MNHALTLCARIAPVLLIVVIGALTSSVAAGDWPMWRHDAERSAASPDALPEELHLAWWREAPTPLPAWPEDERLMFDAVYEPVVVGKTLFVASAQTDSLGAFSTDTGEEKWTFLAEGPVRFAPVVHGGRAYFGADDGYFYCVDALDGRLVWKFRAAPSSRKVLGNDRLISVWPIRGGAVLGDGKIHFTAGVWPFEGGFLYSLDVGKSVDEPDYVATTLPELVPQGYLVQSGNTLLIPGGRAPVTGYDIEKREFIKYDYRVRQLTNYHVSASGQWFFHGDRVFDRTDNKLAELPVVRPVRGVDGAIFYSGNGQKIHAVDLARPEIKSTKDRKGRSITQKFYATKWELTGESVLAALNEVEDQGSPNYQRSIGDDFTIDLRAGARLYGHVGDVVFALDTSADGSAPKVAWARKVAGTPGSMIAADDKLFVATREGGIYCFGGEQRHPVVHQLASAPAWRLDIAAAQRVDSVLKHTGSREGFALVWGLSTGQDNRSYRLIRELLAQSELRIIAIDSDADTVVRLRSRLTAEGLYGERLDLRVGEPSHYDWPPYLANVVLIDNLTASGFRDGIPFVRELFAALRPYGGSACLEIPADNHEQLAKWVSAADLSKSELVRHGSFSVLRRVGELVGTANWEHEYGDPANTLTSPDTLVKPPLGVLWFGGPSSNGDLYYDRHRWPPSMAVIDGRIFVQGPEKLTAIDVYTGRILWSTPIATGLSPGRRGWISVTGFHYVAVQDGIYLTYDRSCVRLDPATGKQLGEFRLPDEKDSWGRIRIVGDQLIVPVFLPVGDDEARGYVSGFRSDRGAPGTGRLPKKIVVLNRHDGTVQWQKVAAQGFLMISVGQEKLFCFDGVLKDFFRSEDRKGIDPTGDKALALRAYDLKSGEALWTKETLMALTWLAYSDEHDVLVASNKNGVEAWSGRDGERMWRRNSIGYGFKGHPESVWNKVIVRKNQVIDQRGPGRFYDILTGRPVQKEHPLTGQKVDWQFTKLGHHCNYAIANEHLLTFRAATGGFFDLSTSGTGRLGGFRTGCRNSLVPACGVLNAPNFAHGCSCDYSLFTSLSFVHVPENEQWTYNTFTVTGDRVTRIGVNFGAPGDRLAPNGTLWLDHPNIGGPSPRLDIKVVPEESRSYRRHASQIAGEELVWVAASGVEGASSVVVPMTMDAEGPREEKPHTVRLFFSEPRHTAPGQRVFSVSLGGKAVIENLDVVEIVGGRDRVLVREFHDVSLSQELNIALTPVTGDTLLNGVEVVAADE